MDLVEQLRALGVREGDLLMVHGSLRAIGLARSQGVERGAEQLLSALTSAVGASGTLLMVLGSDYAMDAVNLLPVEKRGAVLRGSEPFVLAHAPVLPEVGWLAEAFRRMLGTRTSDNPSGRFGAWGARAEELLKDQTWNDYYGSGSPLDKLCAWGGRILRMGANPDTTTALHYAEYLAQIPNKRTTRWDYLLATSEGAKHVWIECLDDAEGIFDWSGEDYFAQILDAYLTRGTHQAGKVGNADSVLLDANDIVQFGARWMEHNFAGA
jgi:aminoglycoside N3'-acetyltransferase